MPLVFESVIKFSLIVQCGPENKIMALSLNMPRKSAWLNSQEILQHNFEDAKIDVAFRKNIGNQTIEIGPFR